MVWRAERVVSGPSRFSGLYGRRCFGRRLVGVGCTLGTQSQEITPPPGRVVRMFRWAVEEGRLSPTVPAALAMVLGLRRGKTTARETEPVADEVVDATLPFLPADVVDMVRLQRLTGARPNEICSMRLRDIARNGDVWIYRPVSHKTEYLGKERRTMIGPKGQKILAKRMGGATDRPCFSPQATIAAFYAKKVAKRKTPLYAEIGPDRTEKVGKERR